MFIFCLLMLPFASATKVLCLHGGGSSAVQFRAQMKQVMADTPELDYVFADGGNWFRDPPGGKMEPTQDPDWDKASIELVKDLVVNQGPFDVVLGFSQGSAFIPAYLSIHSSDFRKAALLSGYLPSTHQGVLKRIQAAAPFSLPALVYLGKEDDIIPYPMTREQAMLFENVELVEGDGGHHVPARQEKGYDELINFLKDEDNSAMIWPWILAAALVGVGVLVLTTKTFF